MRGWQVRLIGLGLPCVLAYALDIGLTLHGQPAEYWAGDYSHTREGAPFWHMLYMWHPAAAITGHLVWASLIVAVLALMPEGLAVVLAATVVFGHTAGAYTWIVPLLIGHFNKTVSAYQAAHVLFLLAAVEVGVGIRWTVRRSCLQSQPEPQLLPRWLRYSLIAGIIALMGAIVFVQWPYRV